MHSTLNYLAELAAAGLSVDILPAGRQIHNFLLYIARQLASAQLWIPAPVVAARRSCARPWLQVVSPRNHMVFTPLLASTCVGTIEPRSVAIPVVRIQKALTQPHNYYFS